MFDCQAATNAGFFSFSGSCVGNSIVDGNVVAWDTPGNPAFGVLANNTVVVGYVQNSDDYTFTSMISGRGWLVRNGKQYVDSSKDFKHPRNNSFVMLKAPRTAVGVKEDGSVFIAVVDGVETLKEGLDLYEWSEILIEKGAV
jgi:exopolysaccharide biosynthesis protein